MLKRQEEIMRMHAAMHVQKIMQSEFEFKLCCMFML